jgi:hypothetical protein
MRQPVLFIQPCNHFHTVQVAQGRLFRVYRWCCWTAFIQIVQLPSTLKLPARLSCSLLHAVIAHELFACTIQNLQLMPTPCNLNKTRFHGHRASAHSPYDQHTMIGLSAVDVHRESTISAKRLPGADDALIQYHLCMRPICRVSQLPIFVPTSFAFPVPGIQIMKRHTRNVRVRNVRIPKCTQPY